MIEIDDGKYIDNSQKREENFFSADIMAVKLDKSDMKSYLCFSMCFLKIDSLYILTNILD